MSECSKLSKQDDETGALKLINVLIDRLPVGSEFVFVIGIFLHSNLFRASCFGFRILTIAPVVLLPFLGSTCGLPLSRRRVHFQPGSINQAGHFERFFFLIQNHFSQGADEAVYRYAISSLNFLDGQARPFIVFVVNGDFVISQLVQQQF